MLTPLCCPCTYSCVVTPVLLSPCLSPYVCVCPLCAPIVVSFIVLCFCFPCELHVFLIHCVLRFLCCYHAFVVCYACGVGSALFGLVFVILIVLCPHLSSVVCHPMLCCVMCIVLLFVFIHVVLHLLSLLAFSIVCYSMLLLCVVCL